MRHHVVERGPEQKGFVVLAGRWIVERSFGWLVPWGGLLRDRAGRLVAAAARLAFAVVLSGVEALLNPMPIFDPSDMPPQAEPTQTGSQPPPTRRKSCFSSCTSLGSKPSKASASPAFSIAIIWMID